MSGRKFRHESRAAEFRQALIAWKQTPESTRPSLRELARELDTSHQLLEHYLSGLDQWQAEERAARIRARAEAEGRRMTMQECCEVIITPGVFRKINAIERKAKRGRLHWADVKILKIWARHFLQAQEVLEKYSRSALKRKSFEQIVKETPYLEGETSVAWVRRILDQCEKYGTDCPTVINEELLEKYSQGKVPPEVHLSNLITRFEAMGGILLLDGDRVLYFVPNKGAKGRALLAELWEHREHVRQLVEQWTNRLKRKGRYEEIRAKICQHGPIEKLIPLDSIEVTATEPGNSAKPGERV